MLLLLTVGAFAQGGSQVQIIQSDKMIGMPQAGIIKVIRPIFSQDNSTLAADSAILNQNLNTFDAYGHVVITQSNGNTIYSDILNYNGNTKLAILTRNVRLIDGDAVLTTDYLTYNMGSRVGTYTGGGKIVNGENTIVSKNGYYFANTDDAYFRYNVSVTNPDVQIKSDTLRYNSASKIAYFYGPTDIYGKDDTLYTERGNYNTSNDQARFSKNNLYRQGSKSLTGDSLFYDKVAGYGKAIKNITFIDTAQKIVLKGDLGEYRKADESTLVTQNAYVVLLSESDSAKVDSIWMAADTLYTRMILLKDLPPVKKKQLKSDEELDDEEDAAAAAANAAVKEAPAVTSAADSTVTKPVIKPVTPPVKPVTTNPSDPKKKVEIKEGGIRIDAVIDTVKSKPRPPDSIAVADTARTRIVLAYRNVKVFKSDMQARADSTFYSYADSTLRCYVNPMMWTQGSQMSGDTIYLQLKNKKLDNMILQSNAFVVNAEKDSVKFNQMKGKLMTGQFKDGKLVTLFVDGNAESLYYDAQDSTGYAGLNRTVSGRIRVEFGKENKIRRIGFIKKAEGRYLPMDKVINDDEILEGFIWKPRDRPKSKEEIIPSLKNAKPVKAAGPTPASPSPKTPVKKAAPPAKKKA